jgi:uncharacterized protein YbjT (DUF2867 family)
VLLLTGATGLVGSALLRRLTARGEPVRCLVRDPRRLGPERVVHLAASPRDQPHATIEELAGLATWRLLRAAEQAGVDHFVFFSALGASPSHHSRLHRAKAIAEQAVEAADLRTTTFAPSLVYSPGDRRLARLDHLAWLPAVPLAGLGRARTQPIWAEDVADCVVAALDRPPGDKPHNRYELAGPDVLSHREIAELALRAAHRRRRLLPVPAPVLRPLLRAYEVLAGPTAVATWDEAEMLGVTMRTPRGTADAEALGVEPLAMREVLAG